MVAEYVSAGLRDVDGGEQGGQVARRLPCLATLVQVGEHLCVGGEASLVSSWSSSARYGPVRAETRVILSAKLRRASSFCLPAAET